VRDYAETTSLYDVSNLIPHVFRKLYAFRSLLDSSAVDQHVYLTTHSLQGFREQVLHGLHVSEVTINDLNADRGAFCTDGLEGGVV
jgi:hypothetical protein